MSTIDERFLCETKYLSLIIFSSSSLEKKVRTMWCNSIVPYGETNDGIVSTLDYLHFVAQRVLISSMYRRIEDKII